MTRIQTGRTILRSSTTALAAGCGVAADVDCGAAGIVASGCGCLDGAAFGSTGFTTVAGGVSFRPRVDRRPSAMTAMMAPTPRSPTLRRFRFHTGRAVGVGVGVSSTASLDATAEGGASGTGAAAADVRATDRAPAGADAGARKLCTNASNSSDFRCRAWRAASIDARSRSSSAIAAGSSNGSTDRFCVTRPLSQHHGWD